MVWTMWNIESNFLFSTRPSGDEHPKGYNAFTPHLGSGLQSTNIHFLFEKRREQKKIHWICVFFYDKECIQK